MIRPKIAILNRSTVVSDEQGKAITESLQDQVTNHFGPIWNTSAKLNYVAKGQEDGWQDKWNVVILDTSDEAGALGYHDYTPEGLPVGKAFARTAELYGYQVSVTICHEVLEMLGDPAINKVAGSYNTLYAYENCDAVESDELGYEIGGILLSDFVTPAWFVDDYNAEIPYSFKENVHAPFELAPGGYISYTNTWPPNWQQHFYEFQSGFSEKDLFAARPKVGSRRERRTTPKHQWIRSAE